MPREHRPGKLVDRGEEKEARELRERKFEERREFIPTAGWTEKMEEEAVTAADSILFPAAR